MMYWGDHMSTGDWVFSILGTLIVLALIIGLIVWAFSAAGGRSGPPSGASSPPGTSAREILDRRLASGELTVEEYEQLRATLGDVPPSTLDSQARHPAGAHG